MRSSTTFMIVAALSILLVAALGLPARLSDDDGNEASMAAPALTRRSIPPFETDLGPNIPPSLKETGVSRGISTPTARLPSGQQFRAPRGLKIIDPESQYLPVGSRVRTTGAPRLPGPPGGTTVNACPSPSPTVDTSITAAGPRTWPILGRLGTPIAGTRSSVPKEGAIYTTLAGSQDVESVVLSTDPMTGKPMVTLIMTRTGARSLYAFSRDALGEPITLVLDGQVLVSPTLSAPVSTRAVIRGLEDDAYARLVGELSPLC